MERSRDYPCSAYAENNKTYRQDVQPAKHRFYKEGGGLMKDLPTRIIETLVELYENQTGEKYDRRQVDVEDSNEQKEKTA